MKLPAIPHFSEVLVGDGWKQTFALRKRSSGATSVVDLTFATVSRRAGKANIKSKITPESYIFRCPFGSDIRNLTRRDKIRMSEPGHWILKPLTPHA
jgi:hypothetical protein